MIYRRPPLWSETVKALFWAAVAVLSLTGCSQTQVSTTGFKTFNTNFGYVSWKPNSFVATKVNTSTPLNSIWRGVNRETDILKDLGLGMAGPTGALPVAVRGAGILGTKFNNPPTETILTR